MKRRQFLCVSAATAGWVLLSGHAPYRQWMVYRQAHLMIITSRDDLAGDELGERIGRVMREALPDSKATVGRGPHVQRIASLIASHQADVGVVSRPNARAMYRGEAPFGEYGAIPLRVLVQNETHQLICRDDFLTQHAFLVAEALAESGQGLGLVVPRLETLGPADIPPHPGALAFARGQPLDLQSAQTR